MKRCIFLIASAISLISCAQNQTQEPPAPKELKGYADLNFGASFEEALAVAGSSAFNAYGISKCSEEIPIRGCLLTGDESSVFRRIDGIPYRLQLAFNKFGTLTDISLEFVRRSTYNEDNDRIPASITAGECRDIIERTVDWVSRDFSKIQVRDGDGSTESKILSTAAGNKYRHSGSANSFLVEGFIPFKSGREIFLLSHFLTVDGEPDCSVDISFQESDRIPRWKVDPKMEAELKQIQESVVE